MTKFKKAVKYLKAGNYLKAKNLLEDVLDKDPVNVKSLINLGIVYKNIGRLEEACDLYKEALEYDKKNFAAYNNLGNAYSELGRVRLAKESYLNAVSIKENYSEALGNLGALFQNACDLPSAEKYYRWALKIDPKQVNYLSNLSTILLHRGDVVKAKKHVEKAIKINPRNASAYNNLGNILRDMKDLQDAREAYKKAIKLDLRQTASYTNLTELDLQQCFWDEAKKMHKKSHEMGAETPFLALRMHKDLEHHKIVAKAASKTIADNSVLYKNKLKYWLKEEDEKIRVGYLSANFNNHPVGCVSIPLFKYHNREKFEVYAYSYGAADGSSVRKDIKKYADKFRDLRSLSDFRAAKLINKDKPEILVDLTGHTKGGRMGIMAYHPSPFQISYLGFCGTSGASFVEYMIVDEVIVPNSEAKYYTENLIYMPGCYQINGSQEVAKKKFVKADFGISKDAFVFCCFNRPYKFDKEIFSAWMKILARVEKSVLVLWEQNIQTIRNLQRVAKGSGVDPKRLVFVGLIPFPDHLARLSVCGLALDTPSYSGGATTANALFVDLPVVTLKGYSYLSRMTESHLRSIRMDELVTNSLKEYIDLAVGLANNSAKLEKVVEKLKINKKKHYLFDAKMFVDNLETVYTQLVFGGKQRLTISARPKLL